MTVLTTGQAIVKALIANGVDTLFGIPGAHLYDFNDACYEHRDQLRFIVSRHEQGAAYMAYGYAKSTGRVGAYAVVPGPGMLNTSAALCTAFGATTPVLCVTGNIMSHLIGKGRGQLHELPDQLATMRGFTKWAERINAPAEAPGVVAEAFRQMLGGRQGPVAIEAPWDVFGRKGEVEAPAAVELPPAPDADPDAIAAVAEIVASARNPLITVGAGAQHAGEEVLELAKLLQCPVTAHRSGRGIVSDELPWAMSPVAGYAYWKNADVLIGIGSRLELQHFRWQWFPEGVKTVRIDIDPAEESRVPCDAFALADAATGTRALVHELSQRIGRRKSREKEFDAIKATAREAIEVLQPQLAYLDVIRDVLPREGFFVEEVSQMGFTARLGFPVYHPRHFITSGYQDNLGFGFNTALGVKVAHPDAPVVAVCGDGGFMYGVQELATAVQHGINLVTLVFNNQSFGNVLRDQIEHYDGHLIGSELTNPDFVKLAGSFGARAYRVSSPAELRPVLEKALGDNAPVVVDVTIERGGETSPWPFYHPAPHTPRKDS